MTNPSTQNLIVLRASAGSGKTYALVKHFLILALQHKSKTYYRSILAITFTNAAASEMKHRVLSTLERIKEGDVSETMWEEIANAVGVSLDEIRSRAQEVLKDMLHHYGMLSILTIDSFTHRLIRSFARDLQLSADFRIEMDATSFKEKLVDACLNAIGEDANDPLTAYLMNYAQTNLEEGKSWNLRAQLIKYSELILKENTSEIMTGIEHMQLNDFWRIRKNLDSARIITLM
ncbi:MAG: UvrD-helicase domain-containing protein [Flavobacteriales bacterium]